MTSMRLAHGQALLISTLVLSTILLGIALLRVSSIATLNQSTLTMENKRIAAAAATGCMESAFDQLGRNGSYVGNEILMVASTTCSIRPIVASSTAIVVETWARVGDQYARYRAVLRNRSPLVIDSWMERGEF